MDILKAVIKGDVKLAATNKNIETIDKWYIEKTPGDTTVVGHN